MVEFFLDFSQKKVGNTKICTKIYNLLATGRKASGQGLFQGCRRASGGEQLPRPGHTHLGGRGVLFRRWSVLKECLREAAAPKARANQSWGTGSPVQAVVGAQGGPTGGSSSQGPGTPVLGDGESCSGGGRCSRRACGGQQLPGPRHTSLGGRGVLSRQWSVLEEGLREAAVPKARAHQSGGTGRPAKAVVSAQGGPAGGSSPQCPGTPVWRDGESCSGGGRCSRIACWGGAIPKARAHQSGGTRSPVQAVVGAQGRPAGGSSSQGPGTPVLGDGESYPGGGRCSRRAYGGQQPPRPGQHQPLGTGSPVQAVLGAQGGSAGGNSPQGPGTPILGDGESCPGGGRCSRRACGGQQSQGPGTLPDRDGESCTGSGRCLGRARGGQQSPRAGHTSLRGWEVLFRRWSVLYEGLRGVAAAKARATPALGDGESCPGGARCSRWVCGRQKSPRPGHTSLGGRGVLSRRWSVLEEGLRGAAVPRPGHTSLGERGVLHRQWSVL